MPQERCQGCANYDPDQDCCRLFQDKCSWKPICIEPDEGNYNDA